MLTRIQDKTTHPIPSLTYGSNVTNAYIQIAQILKRVTAPPLAPPDPAPERRVPLITHPAPEQRVLVPAPILPVPIQQQPTLPVSTIPDHPATKKNMPATRPPARFPLSRLGQRNTSYQHCHTSTNYHPLTQSATNERYDTPTKSPRSPPLHQRPENRAPLSSSPAVPTQPSGNAPLPTSGVDSSPTASASLDPPPNK